MYLSKLYFLVILCLDFQVHGFLKMRGKLNMKMAGALQLTINADTRMQCQAACLNYEGCYAYHFNKNLAYQGSRCELIQPDRFQSDTDYDSFFMTDRIPTSARSIGTPRTAEWGTWGTMLYCNNNTAAYGMNVYHDSFNGPGLGTDDYGVTSLFLHCHDINGENNNRVDFYTYYQGAQNKPLFKCNQGDFIEKFRFYYLASVGISNDDIALDDIQFKCREAGTAIDVGGGSSYSGSNKPSLSWTGYVNCPNGFVLCGMMVQRSTTSDKIGVASMYGSCCPF